MRGWVLGCAVTETERAREACVLADKTAGLLLRRPRRVVAAAVKPTATSMVVQVGTENEVLCLRREKARRSQEGFGRMTYKRKSEKSKRQSRGLPRRRQECLFVPVDLHVPFLFYVE